VNESTKKQKSNHQIFIFLGICFVPVGIALLFLGFAGIPFSIIGITFLIAGVVSRTKFKSDNNLE
jgi:uncharacterized membrane protein HdeD (DUF308 family)